MGWTAQGSNSGGARSSVSVQTGLGTHPAPCTMGSGIFAAGKVARE